MGEEKKKLETTLNGFSPVSSTPVFWKSRKRSDMSGRPGAFKKVGVSAKAAPHRKIGPTAKVASSRDARAEHTSHHPSSKRQKTTTRIPTEGADLEQPTSKSPPRSPASSPACLCDQLLNAAEMKEWEARSFSDQRAAAKRGATDIIMYNLTCDKNLDALGARLAASEDIKSSLKKDNKDLKAKLKQLQEEKASLEKEKSKAATSLASMAAEKEQWAKERLEKDAAHSAEIEQLTSAWEAEKDTLKEESSTEGFRDYLKAFIAADPNYNWVASFGESTAKWVEEFKVVEAEEIAAKKAELDLQRAAEAADALNKEAADHTENPTVDPTGEGAA